MKNLTRILLILLLVSTRVTNTSNCVNNCVNNSSNIYNIDKSLDLDLTGSAIFKMSYYYDHLNKWPLMGLTVSSFACPLYDNIPAIGVYGPDYNFRQKIGIIRMHNEMLLHAPKTMVNSIKKYIGKSRDSRSLSVVLDNSGIECDFYTVITGNLSRKINKFSKEYNMLYHGFLLKDNPNASMCKKNIAMGIFDCDGIDFKSKIFSNNYIKINSLSNEIVWFHDGACSPNNAKLKIFNNREISSFWSAAVSPNKKRIAITYNLLIDNENLENSVRYILKENSNYNILLNNLDIFINSSKINKLDKKAFSNFISKLKAMDKIIN